MSKKNVMRIENACKGDNDNNSQMKSRCIQSPSNQLSRNSTNFLKMLEDHRQKEQSERKRKRQEMKANETSEEKRERRLNEKQSKELRRRQRMGWDMEYQQYTNQDNPFGDPNLMSTFVWNKKLEKEGLHNATFETVEVLSRNKQLENKIELEKVKKRRKERELEKQAREEDIILQQRSKEAAQFQEWERQEDQFHLEQARLRSKIRIEDGRAKPIDLLAQYVSNIRLEDAIEMQMHEPYVILNGLGFKDLEDLLVDIKVYVELEKGNNNDFWDDMITIVVDELQKIKKLMDSSIENTMGERRREGIHHCVTKNVADIFRGKSTSQLVELRNRIENKINQRDNGVDISYWESLLSQLKAHMARARLRDRHQENLKKKLETLKKTNSCNDKVELSNTKVMLNKHGINSSSSNCKYKFENENSDIIKDISSEHSSCFDLYRSGNYSPKYLSLSDLNDEVVLLQEHENKEHINKLRNELIQKRNEEKIITEEELNMEIEARKGMLSDEEEFAVEASLKSSIQSNSDKYRPRKPRYFNRVHTGFEWNKYNQTHYDMDNPPPKIVQGYKFNIFYPDLINKAVTPQYHLKTCDDNYDFTILRFHAGPPYEDIAFKIVNREWEFSYKRGFRCQFHNNIFQLWFHFKRYRYRR